MLSILILAMNNYIHGKIQTQIINRQYIIIREMNFIAIYCIVNIKRAVHFFSRHTTQKCWLTCSRFGSPQYVLLQSTFFVHFFVGYIIYPKMPSSAHFAMTKKSLDKKARSPMRQQYLLQHRSSTHLKPQKRAINIYPEHCCSMYLQGHLHTSFLDAVLQLINWDRVGKTGQESYQSLDRRSCVKQVAACICRDACSWTLSCNSSIGTESGKPARILPVVS